MDRRVCEQGSASVSVWVRADCLQRARRVLSSIDCGHGPTKEGRPPHAEISETRQLARPLRCAGARIIVGKVQICTDRLATLGPILTLCVRQSATTDARLVTELMVAISRGSTS